MPITSPVSACSFFCRFTSVPASRRVRPIHRHHTCRLMQLAAWSFPSCILTLTLPLTSSLQYEYQCFHPHTLSHPTTCAHILFAEHSRSLSKSHVLSEAFATKTKNLLLPWSKVRHLSDRCASSINTIYLRLFAASQNVPSARLTNPRSYPVESNGNRIESCYTAFCDAMKHSCATVIHSRSSHV
jgi:hypothetical protein